MTPKIQIIKNNLIKYLKKKKKTKVKKKMN